MVMQRTIHPLDGSYTILGERRPPQFGQTLAVRSPVDGSVVGAVHEYTNEEIDAILARCAAEQPAWAELPFDQRAATLHRFADELEARADDIAELLVMEVAKARRDARDEIERSAELVRLTVEEARRVLGDAGPGDSSAREGRRKLSISYRIALGTVLAIPPFTYPVNLALSKVAPALAAGNAVVLKPPSQGSLAATVMAELLARSGAPVGVFHLITGRGSAIGDHLVPHQRVSMIAFTGAIETGRELARRAGMVPLLLEVGGKDAAIVLGDADLDAAAADIVGGAFSYSGQRGAAVKRVLCVASVADELVGRLADRIARLSVGDPRRDCAITPLVDPASADRAVAMIDQAVRMGAVMLCGGGRQDNLLEPVLLDHVDENMEIAWVDPLAPVLPVIRVPHAAAAVELANRGDRGPQAAVFGRDLDAATQVALQLEVSTVEINGRPSSGAGTHGAQHSIEAMTRVKSVVLNVRPQDLGEVR